MNANNLQEALTRLYAILIWVDGKVDEEEILFGRKMATMVGIDDDFFLAQIKLLEAVPRHLLFLEAMEKMKALSRSEQVQCIAWLCVIANSDGFMDEKEWKMIYRIYHEVLGLPLKEIMTEQKKISREVFKKSTPVAAVL